MPSGAVLKEMARSLPPGTVFKEEGVIPPMPPRRDRQTGAGEVVKAEERSDDRPLRRRSK
jgi:hypothetical protein